MIKYDYYAGPLTATLSILPNDIGLVNSYFIVYDNVFHIERKINYFIFIYL
jgi:hypothetical protein